MLLLYHSMTKILNARKIILELKLTSQLLSYTSFTFVAAVGVFMWLRKEFLYKLSYHLIDSGTQESCLATLFCSVLYIYLLGTAAVVSQTIPLFKSPSIPHVIKCEGTIPSNDFLFLKNTVFPSGMYTCTGTVCTIECLHCTNVSWVKFALFRVCFTAWEPFCSFLSRRLCSFCLPN